MLQPADVYHCCVQVGLLPRSTDIPPSTSIEVIDLWPTTSPFKMLEASKQQFLLHLKNMSQSMFVIDRDSLCSCISLISYVYCGSSQECQRKAILTMALEHDRVRFITNCVRSWADGGECYLNFFDGACSVSLIITGLQELAVLCFVFSLGPFFTRIQGPCLK